MGAPEVHVVFGAGQSGLPLARLLAERGLTVRMVSRSGSVQGLPGVQFIKADALEADACIEAAKGAAAVYHCMNPKYEAATWEALLPPIQDNLVAAAGRSGARLVFLDNLYSLGHTGGVPMSEDKPVRPCSHKGALRARLAETLIAAHRRGEVRAVIGRASDFFGPGGLQTMFERRFWTRVLAGRSAQVIGNPDMPHTYHYIPDVAAALAVLGTGPENTLGRVWMLPCAPAVTTREFIARMGAALGRDVQVKRFPCWLFRVLKPVVPVFRELDEMLYQWDEPFVVDDRHFRKTFGIVATPLDEALRATVAWARAAFAAGLSRQ